jgi:Ca-activated chloride channel family protein
MMRALAVSLIGLLPIVAILHSLEGSLAQEQSRPTFSTRVDAVRVDVLVTQGNRPVVGLAAADFDLRDNGVPQEIEVVSLEELPLNIVLAFDMSKSVEGDELDELRQASAALLRALKSSDRVALITFSHVVTVRCRLTLDLSCVHDALASVEADGRTALVDGAYTGMIVGESEPGRSLIVVLSDRFDTASWLSPNLVLDTAKRSEVVVYGVSAGDQEAAFLQDLTSATGGRMLSRKGSADLASVFVKILDEFRHRYVLTYTPRGVARPGWHRLQVRVRRGNPTVKARVGYHGEPGF